MTLGGTLPTCTSFSERNSWSFKLQKISGPTAPHHQLWRLEGLRRILRMPRVAAGFAASPGAGLQDLKPPVAQQEAQPRVRKALQSPRAEPSHPQVLSQKLQPIVVHCDLMTYGLSE